LRRSGKNKKAAFRGGFFFDGLKRALFDACGFQLEHFVGAEIMCARLDGFAIFKINRNLHFAALANIDLNGLAGRQCVFQQIRIRTRREKDHWG
jgi:hypothetical protein